MNSEEYCPPAPRMKNPLYTVTVFKVDRAYGGPEEGGWWYDCGYPAYHSKYIFSAPDEYGYKEVVDRKEYGCYVWSFDNREAAASFCRRFNRRLDKWVNKHRRPIYSVLSDGVFEAKVCEGEPKPFPSTRPYYE